MNAVIVKNEFLIYFFLCLLCLVDQIATVVLYSNDSYAKSVAIEDSG